MLKLLRFIVVWSSILIPSLIATGETRYTEWQTTPFLTIVNQPVAANANVTVTMPWSPVVTSDPVPVGVVFSGNHTWDGLSLLLDDQAAPMQVSLNTFLPTRVSTDLHYHAVAGGFGAYVHSDQPYSTTILSNQLAVGLRWAGDPTPIYAQLTGATTVGCWITWRMAQTLTLTGRLYAPGFTYSFGSGTALITTLAGSGPVRLTLHMPKGEPYFVPPVETSVSMGGASEFAAPPNSVHHNVQWGQHISANISGVGASELRKIVCKHTGTEFPVNLARWGVIGNYMTDWRMRDPHSLDPRRPLDNTYLDITREYRLSTNQFATMVVRFADGSVNPRGESIPNGTLYRGTTTPTVARLEEGWTNQTLTIDGSASQFEGVFDVALAKDSAPFYVDNNKTIPQQLYNTESATAVGTSISFYAAERDNPSLNLSQRAQQSLFIDLTPPIPAAEYIGGFVFNDLSWDALSGLSVTNNPTRIAFAEPDTLVEPTTGWQNINSHTMNTTGTYSVWVRATDKAGNQVTERVEASLYVGGEISIKKDTDMGALLHNADCTEFAKMTITDCGLDCSIGASPEIAEKTTFNYEITLRNTATIGEASGTFEDYLPEGVTVIGSPTATATATEAGNPTVNITSVEHSPGHYKISGTYDELEPGETITITIPCEPPVYDDEPSATNIISNQMESTWTIGSGATQINGTTRSNYANHLVEMLGVSTTFTKVNAEDITTGIVGAEFALYRWDGAADPTSDELAHIVDTTGLTDGDWTRVTTHGIDATSPNDVFESATSPLGEVVLGNLLEGIYTLVETKAPVGYELPIGQWILTIEPTATDTPGDYKIEFVGKSPTLMPPAAIRETSGSVHTYKIVNTRPFTIGMSGLSGTHGLLLLGFVLMAVASNAYLIYNYKQKNKCK